MSEYFYVKYLEESKENKSSISNHINFINKYSTDIQMKLIYQTENEIDLKSELSFSGKWLLIAAFLASYNSDGTDKRFFSKFQGCQKAFIPW